MENKKDILIYEQFANKLIAEYTEFQEICRKAKPLWVFSKAELICFMGNVCALCCTDEIQTVLKSTECKLIVDKFDNRILCALYMYWNDTDFMAMDRDTLKRFIKVFVKRTKNEDDFMKYSRPFFKSFYTPYEETVEKNIEELYHDEEE